MYKVVSNLEPSNLKILKSRTHKVRILIPPLVTYCIVYRCINRKPVIIVF